MNSITNYITEIANHYDKWEKLFDKIPLNDIADSLYHYYVKEFNINLSIVNLNDRFYQAVSKSGGTNEEKSKSFKTLNRYYVHHQWDKKRQIYVLDPVFAEELMNTQNLSILQNMFSRLPCNTFAVDFSKSISVIETAGISGAVIAIDLYDEYWFVKTSFRDMEDGQKGYASLNLFIENKDIDCSPEEFVEKHCRISKDDDVILFQSRTALWNLLLHTLVYFSSYEPDIRETAQSKAQ